MDSCRIELSVQRAQNRSGRGREILRVAEASGRTKEQFDRSDHRDRKLRELRRQVSEHLIAQRLSRHSLEELEKAPSFVVEPIENYVLDADAAEVHDAAHRSRGERRVDNDRQGGESPMDLFDYVDAKVAVDDRINDQDVRDALQDSGSQLIPSTGCDEIVL
jgi:hypothetical protein